jgi:N-acetylglucosaminyldiphosphoundecaprenol N-acetyl-beta-D-mannosaminyltransferase
MIQRDRILSVPVDRGSPAEMLEEIAKRAIERSAGHVCFANVHSLHQASTGAEFLSALEAAILVTPDGMPLARALSWIGPRQDRVEGMDAFPKLLELAAQRGIPVAFFGADPITLGALAAKASRELPQLKIVEAIAPERGPLPFSDDVSHVARLAKSEAGIVFVALGCPKQELWMHRHSSQIPAVLVGVGNAFRTWLGLEKRAPRWMRWLCLEWIVRLYQDPRRLWKRYLVSNSWFLFVAVPRLVVRRILDGRRGRAGARFLPP